MVVGCARVIIDLYCNIESDVVFVSRIFVFTFFAYIFSFPSTSMIRNNALFHVAYFYMKKNTKGAHCR